MCGIAGVVGLAEPDIIERMTASLAHRGPDDSGTRVFAEDGVSLGHRRLSILDLSAAGHQPMATPDGRLTIVYNGELYNFRELRRKLEQQGVRFRSTSDTEVVLHAYAAWGAECLPQFTGMFAFAIWDSRTKTLFAARDQLGVKPFYYTEHSGMFAFASEAKALLQLPGISREVDQDGVLSILQFLWIPEPKSIFRHLAKLPAGHYLRYHDGRLRIQRYWEIPIGASNGAGEAAYIDRLREKLGQAVQRQMVSDVPVGAFLSGGLDSSAVVALARQSSSSDFATYTITFRRDDSRLEAMPDDAKYARQVATLFDTRHHEIEIKPDIVELLPKMLWHLDEPIADPAAINTYLIARAARDNGTTVLLNGMGGDEIFAGYRKHLAAVLAVHYRKLPHWLRAGVIEKLVAQMPVAIGGRGLTPVRWAKRFLKSAGSDALGSFTGNYAYYGEGEWQQLLAPEFYRHHRQTYAYQRHIDYYATLAGLDYVNQMCFIDSKLFLASLNLNYSDKASMAAGVESRPPLVDHHLVEYAFRMPGHYKLRRLQSKYILKKAMEGVLPREIIYRPKAPFGAPLRAWVKRDLDAMIGDLLSDDAIRRRGLLQPRYVRRIIDDDRAGRQDNAHRIWALLTLELWFRIFVDGESWGGESVRVPNVARRHS